MRIQARLHETLLLESVNCHSIMYQECAGRANYGRQFVGTAQAFESCLGLVCVFVSKKIRTKRHSTRMDCPVFGAKY
jgi:hypothetical protein